MECLCNEFKVACEIYRANVSNTPIWFTKVVEIFQGKIDKHDISSALDTLIDWMIIEGHYDSIGNGRSSYVYKISPEHIDRIKEIYENFYVKED